MGLYFPHLIPQIDKMAEELAEEVVRRRGSADKARELLKRYSLLASDLRAKARVVGAAIPSDEPIDHQEAPKSVPSSFFAIAADGSQIQPDRHGIALYYLINVGSIILRENSGETPLPRSVPFLYYRDEDLYEGNRLVQGNLLDVRRGLAEIKELSERVKEAADRARKDKIPILALMDGTLLLWILEEEKTLHLDKIRAYTREMEEIRNAGALLAGFISRPRYCEVVDLLRLAHFGEEIFNEPPLRRPWGSLTDASLFSFLPPGWRSALFESPSILNDYYGENRIFFFYLNIGGEIARVEVPGWIAEHKDLLALVHGTILKQSENTNGYPYVLERAHELAVIKAQERKSLEEMIERAMVRKGLIPRVSPKERWKRLI